MKVRVLCQYYENYGDNSWNGKGELPKGWKPKFGHEFEFDVDSNIWGWWSEEERVDFLNTVCENQSNNFGRIEYREHEEIFHEVENLTEVVGVLLETYLKKKRLELVDSEGQETMLGKIVDEGDYEVE